MPDPSAILANNIAPVQQRLVSNGYVSTVKPAPVSFASGLFVIIPEYSTEVTFGPCEWGAIHGKTLPGQGARVVIVFDEREVPVVVWWDGVYS